MDELIEKLRSVKWDVIAEGDRMPDDPTRECVFVDMRPAEFQALLREAAAALEAARKDAERGEDDAWCAECGVKLENVRPGKHQHPICSQAAPQQPAESAEPVAWVSADTLNSPHPTCVSSLAYVSQLDKDRGREYVPLYAALEAAREDGWQPIETAPKPDIGANGFGERLLLVVDCGDGTTPSVRKGYWEGTDWYLDCCGGLATAYGYRVTHWRPLPEPPAIDREPNRSPYNASGSLSEYGIFPECDAALAHGGEK